MIKRMMYIIFQCLLWARETTLYCVPKVDVVNSMDDQRNHYGRIFFKCARMFIMAILHLTLWQTRVLQNRPIICY